MPALTITAALLTGHLGFAIFSVVLARRTVLVAVTKEIDPTCNPLGLYSISVGAARLSSAAKFDVIAAVVKEHAARYRAAGRDGEPLYDASIDEMKAADFRAHYLAR